MPNVEFVVHLKHAPTVKNPDPPIIKCHMDAEYAAMAAAQVCIAFSKEGDNGEIEAPTIVAVREVVPATRGADDVKPELPVWTVRAHVRDKERTYVVHGFTRLDAIASVYDLVDMMGCTLDTRILSAVRHA